VRLKSLKRRIILQTGSPQLTYKAMNDQNVCRACQVPWTQLPGIWKRSEQRSWMPPQLLSLIEDTSNIELWKNFEISRVNLKAALFPYFGADSKVCIKLPSGSEIVIPSSISSWSVTRCGTRVGRLDLRRVRTLNKGSSPMVAARTSPS